MKLFRFIAAALVTAASLVISVSAQAPASRPPATTPAAGGAATTAATGKIAIIDSSAFSDDKAGIGRVVNAMKTVDAQFQPLRTEVQGMQTQYQTLVSEIEKTAPVAKPQEIQAKTDQAETLKRNIERKTQDAQLAIQKRMQEVLGPLQEDVYNTLQVYAQQRGISVIIDVSRVPVIYFADTVDITKEFITEYNRSKPATASAAPARPAGRP